MPTRHATATSTRTAVLTAAGVAFALIAQQVASKAIRDALFLSHFPADDLPLVMIASAGVAFLVVLSVSRAIAAWAPRRVVPALLVANAALFACEWLVAGSHARHTAVLLYLHTAGLGAAIVSAFWSMINERFDPHTAKRVVSNISGGAAAGGVVGGVAAWQLAEAMPLASTLLVLAGVNVAAALAAPLVGAAPASARLPSAPSAPSAYGALRVMRETRYLRHLALLVALCAAGDAAVDYVFKSAAAARYATGSELVAFFALFHTATGLATFALHAGLARRSLAKLGIAGTIAFYPAVVIAGGIAALAAPAIWTVTALRGASTAAENSLYRSGYELLYTPIPKNKKRPTKTLIDVGCEKLGGALGSGFAMLALLALPTGASAVLIATTLVLAVVTLLVTRRLQRGYVAALADSLRSGAVQLEDQQLTDATTRQTFAETMALDRHQLLADIEALRSSGGVPGAPPSKTKTINSTVALDETANTVAALRATDTAIVREALRSHTPLPRELVAHVIPLLARDELLALAMTALRTTAPRATGQLLDALLDDAVGVRVRRRLPRVLRTCRTQRAVDGLLEGLNDPVFEVRYRCATALLRITSCATDLQVNRELVLAAARAEALRDEGSLADADDVATAFEREAATQKLGRTLTYVFTLLALIFDREPLHLAFCALGADDRGLRGTGREYLDNVLPSDLRDSLRRHLGDRELARAAARPRQAIIDDLMTSRDSLTMDLAAIRRTDDQHE